MYVIRNRNSGYYWTGIGQLTMGWTPNLEHAQPFPHAEHAWAAVRPECRADYQVVEFVQTEWVERRVVACP